ncbi:MAG: hypothetical protein J3R72DRAFT_372939, partial [Linnemannia gamsii]
QQPIHIDFASSTTGQQNGNKKAKAEAKHYVCDHAGCGCVFTRRFSLESHRKMHDPEPERPFQCGEAGCTKTFARKGDWTRHLASVHMKGGSQHKCNSCQTEFTREDALLRHYQRSKNCTTPPAVGGRKIKKRASQR